MVHPYLWSPEDPELHPSPSHFLLCFLLCMPHTFPATEDFDAILVASLLNLHCTDHATRTACSTTTTPQVEKVRRPTIWPAGTSEDWSYFQSRWSEYNAATKIQGNDIVIKLLECCDEQLHKDLTRNAGGSLSGQPEATVMAVIRSLAVREENCLVARVQLHQMWQDRDEPLRSL